MDEQEQLVVDLVVVGVDLIQIEGGISVKFFSVGYLGLIEKVVFILVVVYSISCVVDVFVLCVFGLFVVILLMVIVVGVVGVGVGFVVNCLQDELVMVVVVCGLCDVFGSIVVICV